MSEAHEIQIEDLEYRISNLEGERDLLLDIIRHMHEADPDIIGGGLVDKCPLCETAEKMLSSATK